MTPVALSSIQLNGLIANLPLMLESAADRLALLSGLFSACMAPVEDDSDLRGRMALIDELYSHATDADHFAAKCADAVTDRVYEYEMKHLRLPNVSPAEALASLMRDRGTKQVELRAVATQSVVSEILHGKRSMTVAQIKGFAEFFSVPNETFMGENVATASPAAANPA